MKIQEMKHLIRELEFNKKEPLCSMNDLDCATISQSCPVKKSSQKGLQDGWSRATFILKKEYIDKLKALSYWERTTIKEIIDEALSGYLQDKDIDL